MSQNEESKASTTTSVLAEVASVLGASSPDVRKRLVTVLAERELSKRVDLLDKGLAKLRDLKREVDKIRPPVSFTADGTKVEGTFSKSDFENLKKSKEKVAKLESALEKAFAGQEFDKLANLASGKDASSSEDASE